MLGVSVSCWCRPSVPVIAALLHESIFKRVGRPVEYENGVRKVAVLPVGVGSVPDDLLAAMVAEDGSHRV